MPPLFSPNGAANASNAVPASQNPDGGAASSSNIINKGSVTLATPSDLTIRILSPRDRYGKKTLNILFASKEKLLETSKFFRDCLKYPLDKKLVEFDDDHAEALLIWCSYFHGCARSTTGISISTVWHVIHMGDKYGFELEILRKWFEQWYKRNVKLNCMTPEFASQVALPCWCFDYAIGYAEIAKWLCYNNEGRITEHRPPGFSEDHQHLAPKNFMSPINWARGRLKTVLHQRIMQHCDLLMEKGSCGCGNWKATTGGHLHALTVPRAYPIEKVFPRTSVEEIISRLMDYEYKGEGTCDLCRRNWENDVSNAWVIALGYFDGLCMDCMGRSNFEPKTTGGETDTSAETETRDELYWKKNVAVDGRWDTHCQFKHGEPTWYMSFCGQPQDRQKLVNERQLTRMKPKSST